MERFQEGLLVEGGLCLDELPIDPLEHRVLAEGEWIMKRLFDGEVCIAPHAVDVGDRVTDSTCDAGVCRRVGYIIEIGIVQLTRKEWYGIMAASTPTYAFGISIACERDLSCFTHAGKVGGIVE